MSVARVPTVNLAGGRADGWSLRHLPPSVVLMDLTVLHEAEPSTVERTLVRVRSARLRLILVEADVPSAREGGIIRPGGSERIGGEVQPSFVRRLCAEAGVPTAAGVVISSQRPLLAAADGAGARGVMVPGASTPPFQVRALPHVAPDLSDAVDTILGWASAYAT